MQAIDLLLQLLAVGLRLHAVTHQRRELVGVLQRRRNPHGARPVEVPEAAFERQRPDLLLGQVGGVVDHIELGGSAGALGDIVRRHVEVEAVARDALADHGARFGVAQAFRPLGPLLASASLRVVQPLVDLLVCEDKEHTRVVVGLLHLDLDGINAGRDHRDLVVDHALDLALADAIPVDNDGVGGAFGGLTVGLDPLLDHLLERLEPLHVLRDQLGVQEVLGHVVVDGAGEGAAALVVVHQLVEDGHATHQDLPVLEGGQPPLDLPESVPDLGVHLQEDLGAHRESPLVVVEAFGDHGLVRNPQLGNHQLLQLAVEADLLGLEKGDDHGWLPVLLHKSLDLLLELSELPVGRDQIVGVADPYSIGARGLLQGVHEVVADVPVPVGVLGVHQDPVLEVHRLEDPPSLVHDAVDGDHPGVVPIDQAGLGEDAAFDPGLPLLDREEPRVGDLVDEHSGFLDPLFRSELGELGDLLHEVEVAPLLLAQPREIHQLGHQVDLDLVLDQHPLVVELLLLDRRQDQLLVLVLDGDPVGLLEVLQVGHLLAGHLVGEGVVDGLLCLDLQDLVEPPGAVGGQHAPADQLFEPVPTAVHHGLVEVVLADDPGGDVNQHVQLSVDQMDRGGESPVHLEGGAVDQLHVLGVVELATPAQLHLSGRGHQLLEVCVQHLQHLLRGLAAPVESPQIHLFGLLQGEHVLEDLLLLCALVVHVVALEGLQPLQVHEGPHDLASVDVVLESLLQLLGSTGDESLEDRPAVLGHLRLKGDVILVAEEADELGELVVVGGDQLFVELVEAGAHLGSQGQVLNDGPLLILLFSFHGQ